MIRKNVNIIAQKIVYDMLIRKKSPFFMTNMSKHNTTDISPYCFNQNLILVGIEKWIYTAISNFISCLSCGLRARVKDFQWLHLHLQFIFVLPRVGICVICARKTFTCGKQEAMVLMQLVRTPNLFCFFPETWICNALIYLFSHHLGFV